MVSFWLSLWFKILFFTIAVVAALIIHFLRIQVMKDQQSHLESQLIERNELLQYAGLNEKKATDKLLIAEQNKGDLLSKINHELRAPVNGMMEMAVLLKATDLTDAQLGYLDAIIQTGENQLKVINEIIIEDILKYSKIESVSK